MARISTSFRAYLSEEGRHVSFCASDAPDCFVLFLISGDDDDDDGDGGGGGEGGWGMRLAFLSTAFRARFPETSERLRTAHRTGDAFLTVRVVAAGDGEGVSPRVATDVDDIKVGLYVGGDASTPPLLEGGSSSKIVRLEVWTRFVQNLRRATATGS